MFIGRFCFYAKLKIEIAPGMCYIETDHSPKEAAAMILVTGATGFVGEKILKVCKDTVACPSLKNATEDQVSE
jgi:hypothetical protein